jgi:ketosteroid isomerase-like protein
MKTTLCILLLSAAGITLTAQTTTDEQAIRNTITQFAKAGDKNDAKALEVLLDSNYRIVMNQLFGSPGVVIMDRATYIEKIRTKEYGGEKRTVTIESITINGNTASAKVVMKGTKMTFVSLFELVKGSDGQWKIVSDMPTIGS